MGAVRARYAGLFTEASALLFEADPVGINFEENSDEYELEVVTILPRLEGATSLDDARQIVRDEFEAWFAPGLFNADRLDHATDELWKLWTSWKSTPESGSHGD